MQVNSISPVLIFFPLVYNYRDTTVDAGLDKDHLSYLAI